jgi:transitional endoplasmic reticulum ATPase
MPVSGLRPRLDPELFSDVSRIGVFHFEAGAREFLRWSDRMAEDLGEWVRPHLREVWTRMPVIAREEAQRSIKATTPPDEARKIKAAADLFNGIENEPLGLVDVSGREVTPDVRRRIIEEGNQREERRRIDNTPDEAAQRPRPLGAKPNEGTPPAGGPGRPARERTKREPVEHVLTPEGWVGRPVERPAEKRPVELADVPPARVERQKGASQIENDLSGLAKVAGMQELKTFLVKDVVRPFREPEKFKRYGLSIPHGILLFGPPGCGKTYLACQLAQELGCTFIKASGSDIGSPFIHQSAIQIRELFERAEKAAPSVLFIDEFEGMVPQRAGLGSHQQYKSEEVNEFLLHLNDCAEKNILVIAATNEPETIDAAVLRPGRMDKHVYVSPPDAEARFEMLRFHLSGRPTEARMDLHGIAAILEGYSPSEIRLLVDEAAREALEEGSEISTDMIMTALGRVPPSITEEVVERYRAFRTRGI